MKKKLICCIGDSLTEGDYGVFGMAGIANVKEKNYPYFLKEFTGCEVKNFGYCGYQSINILDLFKSGNIDVFGSDIIIIMLGTNGGQTPEGNSENDKAYYEILRLCKEQSPNAKIFICTPPHVTTDPKKSGYGCFDKVINANQFVKKTAKEKNLSLIDVFGDNRITSESENVMQPNDGVHFSEVGYYTLATIIYEIIKDYV